MNRRLVIAVNVVLFHLAALWALQSGLLRRAVEIVVPAEVLSEFVSPSPPKTELPKPPTPAVKPVAPQIQKSAAPPVPQPLATASPAPKEAARKIGRAHV